MRHNRIVAGCFSLGVVLILVGQSWPNLSVLGGQLNTEQMLLLLMVPLLLFSNKKDIIKRDSLIFLLVFGLLLWLSLANVVFKNPTYSNLREIKNTILVFVLSYLLCINVVSCKEGLWWVIKAIVLGAVVFLVLVSPKIDFSAALVRQIGDRDFVETFGVGYIWIGYISGVTVIFSFLLATVSKELPRLLWLISMMCGMVFLIISGTRAAIVGLPLSILLTLGVRRIKAKTATRVFISVLILLAVIPVFAVVLFYILPDPAVAPEFRGGQDRLLLVDNWLSALQARLQDWDAMMPEMFSLEGVFGVNDYENAISKTRVLGHPHNTWVWMYMMGGFPALVLFGILLACLFKMLHVVIEKDNDLVNVKAAMAFSSIFMLTVFIMITNSLTGATPAIFGINVAIIEYLATDTIQKRNLSKQSS